MKPNEHDSPVMDTSGNPIVYGRLPTLAEVQEAKFREHTDDFEHVMTAFNSFMAAARVLRNNVKQFHAVRGIEEPSMENISLTDLAKLVRKYRDVRK